MAAISEVVVTLEIETTENETLRRLVVYRDDEEWEAFLKRVVVRLCELLESARGE